MLKGIQKRAIIVKTPDPEVFEEAIFIVSEHYLLQAEGSEKKIMRHAEELASAYMREQMLAKRPSLLSRARTRFTIGQK